MKKLSHDDVIKWKHFPRYWLFLRGIHRSPVNSPYKGQWRGALMFFNLHPNKRLSKHSRGWWFETPLSPLWRHRNENDTLEATYFVCTPWYSHLDMKVPFDIENPSMQFFPVYWFTFVIVFLWFTLKKTGVLEKRYFGSRQIGTDYDLVHFKLKRANFMSLDFLLKQWFGLSMGLLHISFTSLTNDNLQGSYKHWLSMCCLVLLLKHLRFPPFGYCFKWQLVCWRGIIQFGHVHTWVTYVATKLCAVIIFICPLNKHALWMTDMKKMTHSKYL